MPGFYVQSGYVGIVDGKRMLFATETDYFEHLEDDANDEKS